MKTIVYIDDDLDDIAVFQEAIQTINPSFILQPFSDSHAAIEFLEGSMIKPDIIFLDINMPRLSGTQALMLIRRMSEYADVPVVMYSTTIIGADKKVFLELGATDFLKKPVHFDDVVKEIEQVINRFVLAKDKQ